MRGTLIAEELIIIHQIAQIAIESRYANYETMPQVYSICVVYSRKKIIFAMNAYSLRSSL